MRTLVRLEPQGVLMPQDHPLAAEPGIDVTALTGDTVLIHPRETNPGHYDALMEIFVRAGVEPRLLLRSLPFDAAHTPVARGQAVAVVGESALPGLPAGLVWRPLAPTTTIEIHLLTGGRSGSPAVAHLLRAAGPVVIDRGPAVRAGSSPSTR